MRTFLLALIVLGFSGCQTKKELIDVLMVSSCEVGCALSHKKVVKQYKELADSVKEECVLGCKTLPFELSKKLTK
jgi:hypothetical protein